MTYDELLQETLQAEPQFGLEGPKLEQEYLRESIRELHRERSELSEKAANIARVRRIGFSGLTATLSAFAGTIAGFVHAFQGPTNDYVSPESIMYTCMATMAAFTTYSITQTVGMVRDGRRLSTIDKELETTLHELSTYDHQE